MKGNDTRRNSAAIETPDPSGALAAVGALMEERRRFEGWIAALTARRAATPPHVYERVHLDYTTRLDAVIDQLTSHADELRRAVEALTSRLTELGAEQQRTEDERAEAELRAHVGEISTADWERMAATSDAAIAGVANRRTEAELELSRIRELLDSTARPAAPVVAAPPAEVPTAAPTARVSRPMAAEALPAPVADSAVPQRISVPVAVAEPDSVLPAELPPAVIAAEQQSLDIEERPPVAASPAPVEEAPVAPRAPLKSNGFDELAFLSSVVDTPAGAFVPAPSDLPDEKARRDTFAMRSQEDQITNLGARATPMDMASIEREDAPPSTGGAAPTSAMNRDSSGEGVKSLKCGECGALNYPTEWYCERCGAELASL